MGAYSLTPLPKKLGIKEGSRVALVNPPAGFEKTLGGLPTGAVIDQAFGRTGSYDVFVFFVECRLYLSRGLTRLRKRMKPAAGLWVAWPKRASGVATDLTEDVVREEALAAKLVDNKVCSIDDTWSGLRLVIRLRDRR